MRWRIVRLSPYATKNGSSFLRKATKTTTTTVNLGVGLALQGKKVLLIDADPQGDLTTSLGWPDNDSLSVTLATLMEKVVQDEPIEPHYGILRHAEGVDLVPANMELSGLEVSLVGADEQSVRGDESLR